MGLNREMTGIFEDPSFPADRGTTIDVRCKNPEHAMFSGSVQITCDKGKTFKFAGQMPKCKTPGKFCKRTIMRSQEKSAL